MQRIAQEIHGPAICALSRAVPEDIQACGRALAKAKRPRIHTGIGASDIHILGKFRDDRYGRTLGEKKVTILKMAVDAVKLAKTFVDDVEFYAEDSGRSDPAYLFEMLEAVIDAGATVLNIPDTTGYTVPEQYGALIRSIKTKVREHRPRDHQRALRTTTWAWRWPTRWRASRTARGRWKAPSTASASVRAMPRSKRS